MKIHKGTPQARPFCIPEGTIRHNFLPSNSYEMVNKRRT